MDLFLRNNFFLITWNFPRSPSLFAFLAALSLVSGPVSLNNSIYVRDKVQQDVPVHTFPAGDFGGRTKQNK